MTLLTILGHGKICRLVAIFLAIFELSKEAEVKRNPIKCINSLLRISTLYLSRCSCDIQILSRDYVEFVKFPDYCQDQVKIPNLRSSLVPVSQV